jgi:hypothetical protein
VSEPIEPGRSDNIARKWPAPTRAVVAELGSENRPAAPPPPLPPVTAPSDYLHVHRRLQHLITVLEQTGRFRLTRCTPSGRRPRTVPREMQGLQHPWRRSPPSPYCPACRVNLRISDHEATCARVYCQCGKPAIIGIGRCETCLRSRKSSR